MNEKAFSAEIVSFDDELRRAYLRHIVELGVDDPFLLAQCAAELTPQKVAEDRARIGNIVSLARGYNTIARAVRRL